MVQVVPLNCSSGFSVSGNGEHVYDATLRPERRSLASPLHSGLAGKGADDVNDEGTSVKWRNVGGAFNYVAAVSHF